MKLTFYGGARTVTGANYLLEEGKTKILIDCGLFQGSGFAERQNFEPLPYSPKTIDAVLITHAHIDHTGRLPKLCKEGFKGKIFSTPPTKEFAKELLLDSEHLLLKEAEEKKLAPLYSIDDINQAMLLWKTAEYRQKFKISDFEIEFRDAGHILGAAFIVITSVKTGKKIIFSGDLGNIDMPFIKETEGFDRADYLVIESVYGNRVHEDVKVRKDILEDLIEDIVKAGGVLMIPAFAVERTQELLYELNELIENGRVSKIPVFIDSPLAIKLTSVYKKYSKDSNYFDKEALDLIKKGDAIFNFPGLKMTLTVEQSKEINDVRPPKIIVAGAGMSQGGRILHHERRYLPDPKSALLFLGYQAKGSLGRQILDGARTVKIFGEEVAVNCRVKAIGAYSAHADQPRLLSLIGSIRNDLKKVFVVQGEDEQSLPLAQKIQDELAVEATAPFLNEGYILE